MLDVRYKNFQNDVLTLRQLLEKLQPFNMKTVVAGLVALAGIVSADVALWGQCGGTGWTGETKCVAGAQCQYSNDYYSQCVPGMNVPAYPFSMSD